jgi:hypothetical protein
LRWSVHDRISLTQVRSTASSRAERRWTAADSKASDQAIN